MNIAAWFSLIVFLLVAAVCLDVALGWRKLAELRRMPDVLPGPAPAVSIVVAALNEADTIAPALNSLLDIDYPRLEVIVINDRSTDATPDIIESIAHDRPSLRVIHLHQLPPGWLGKNHALQRGAEAANGDYLLFTDADAVFEPSSIRRAVRYCEDHQIDHLSLLFEPVARPRLLQLLLVTFGAGFMARFRPWKVRESKTHHVGIGGFNLLRRDAYFAAGGHAAMPLAVLDDMMLGKLLKRRGNCQELLGGRGMVSIEWYRDTAGLVGGLEKNIFAGFDYRLERLAAASLLVVATPRVAVAGPVPDGWHRVRAEPGGRHVRPAAVCRPAAGTRLEPGLHAVCTGGAVHRTGDLVAGRAAGADARRDRVARHTLSAGHAPQRP